MKPTYVPKWWRSLVSRLPRLSDNRPRFRTLFIGASVGDVETIAWDAVPEGVPSIYSYDRIVVIPAIDTNTQQMALRDRLRDELELAPDTYVQVFWILNEAFAPEIPASIGLGGVTSLQKVQFDSVRTPLPLDIGAVVLGIGKLPRAAIPLAHAHIHRTHTSIAVAAMSSDTKWVLIPPVDASAISGLRLRIIRPRTVLTGILTVLLVLCIAGFHQYRALRAATGDRASRLWAARPTVELPLWRHPGNSAWSSAANQMALRLLRSYATNLSKLAVNAQAVPEAPETPEPNLARFDVALLGGDTQSAYRLLKDMRFTSWQQEEWAHHTTEILWQRSVESLHEYDFDSASYYVPLYLNSLRIVKLSAKDPGDLQPYRISSLAHIAARELASGRIRSICGTDGVADSFGRLLGRGWGESLPDGDIPGLRAQRARNAAQCALPLAAAVDYDGIATLDIYFKNEAAIPLLPPPKTLDCTTTPLECTYLDLRTRLQEGKLAQIGGDPFARTCSYLLDDLVADALDDNGTAAPLIAATALDNALSCPDAYDHRKLIEGALAELPCTRIHWDEHKFASIPMQVIAQRCHE